MKHAYPLISLCCLMLAMGLTQHTALARQLEAVATLSIEITGEEQHRSDSAWSSGRFRYHMEVSTTLVSDGEASEINVYDPDYATNAMARANADLARIQAALQGDFSAIGEEEQEPESRYLLWTGEPGCKASLRVEIVEDLHGEYADVGGMQPYTQTYTADSDSSALQRDMMCVAATSVLDIIDNTLYRPSFPNPEVQGRYRRAEANRSPEQLDDASIHSAIPSPIFNVIFSTLQKSPAQGELKTRLSLDEGIIQHPAADDVTQATVDIDMRWSFTPTSP